MAKQIDNNLAEKIIKYVVPKELYIICLTGWSAVPRKAIAGIYLDSESANRAHQTITNFYQKNSQIHKDHLPPNTLFNNMEISLEKLPLTSGQVQLFPKLLNPLYDTSTLLSQTTIVQSTNVTYCHAYVPRTIPE